MQLSEAKIIAEKYRDILLPFCYRIQIAGSIRREKPEVKDIEIVCIPQRYDTGLFESGIATVVNRWQKVKGELEYGFCKYTQRILPEGINLDLFFATPENWGNILLIRTGDWEFSKRVMGVLLPQNGYRQVDGVLKHGERTIPCFEEEDVFQRAALPYIEPWYRSLDTLYQMKK